MIVLPPDAERAGLPIPQERIAGTKQIVVADLHDHWDLMMFQGMDNARRHVVIDIQDIGDIRPVNRFEQPTQFYSGLKRVDASVQKAQDIGRGKLDVCPKRLFRFPGRRQKIVLICGRPCSGITYAERNRRMPPCREVIHHIIKIFLDPAVQRKKYLLQKTICILRLFPQFYSKNSSPTKPDICRGRLSGPRGDDSHVDLRNTVHRNLSKRFCAACADKEPFGCPAVVAKRFPPKTNPGRWGWKATLYTAI